MSETQSRGRAVLGWYAAHLRPKDDTGPARALRARLRRATVLEAVGEAPVVKLYDSLGRPDPERLAALVRLLAHVEAHQGQRLARLMGGDPPRLAPERFQRLIRTEAPEELATQLIRALPLAGGACNVAALGEDFLRWNERTRVNWCFDYYRAPQPLAEGADEEETAS